MIQTVGALADENGGEEPLMDKAQTALLSEATLAEDWNRAEQNEAWSHLLPNEVACR